ncbi:hypothetical protein RJ639_039212 [Escallonia herrerae]|uniref:Uncharacterized protein n=1 Tax=Escallonia herrerae TaxID=1293975 RepID=A0AA88X164_9ASTE|nr:hypothetical protein RJ639_039212 [Escallonia herrerae]
MFRAISTVRAQLRPLPQTLTLSPIPSPFALPLDSPHSVPPNPSISILSSPFTSTPPRLRQGDDDSSSSDWSPKLFVVQPRLRPATALQAKLDEALNLANSLEEQRDVSYGTEFFKKELPGHVVVQNPAARSTHAGRSPKFSSFLCTRHYKLRLG